MPQQGALNIKTEFGKIRVEPNEICVIQVKAYLSRQYSCLILGIMYFNNRMINFCFSSNLLFTFRPKDKVKCSIEEKET